MNAPLDTTYEIRVRPVQDGKNFQGFLEADGEILDGFTQRFTRFSLQSAARRLLPDERVAQCLRVRRKDVEAVSVYRRDNCSTYYGGLTVCGSTWTCPVCAAKISERRRTELTSAVSTWKDRGGFIAFLTFTVPHTIHSKPFELVDTLLELYRALNSGRNRMSVAVPNFVGQVKALEVTHGEHGWHPHFHVLLFVDKKPDLQEIHKKIWSRWESLVRSSGLGVPSESAFKVEDGSKAAQYVSKWGIPEEMTKGHIKNARSERGRTPFALLADYNRGDKQAGALFRQFAQTFKGRQQIRWSAGLRNLLEIGLEKTDEQVSQSVDALDQKLATISDQQWRIILRHDLRSVVLELFRTETINEFNTLIENYRLGFSTILGSGLASPK